MMLAPIFLICIFLRVTYSQDFEFPELPNFENPCSCDDSYCECCLSAIIIEGCLRVSNNNDTVRVSFVFNGDDLGGFSFQTSGGKLPSRQVTFRVPCLPGLSASLRLKNRRASGNNRKFCLNLVLRRPRRKAYDNDFCFDINSDNIMSAVS